MGTAGVCVCGGGGRGGGGVCRCGWEVFVGVGGRCSLTVKRGHPTHRYLSPGKIETWK